MISRLISGIKICQGYKNGMKNKILLLKVFEYFSLFIYDNDLI